MLTNNDNEHLYCRSLNINDFNQLKTSATKAFDNDLNYPDEFYISMLNSQDYLLLGLFDESNILIGCISTYLVNYENKYSVADELKNLNRLYPNIFKIKPAAYISLLFIDYKYRKRGLASFLITKIKEYYLNNYKINSVYLHVQVNNLKAIKLYQGLGFSILACIKDYYQESKSEEKDGYLCLIDNY